MTTEWPIPVRFFVLSLVLLLTPVVGFAQERARLGMRLHPVAADDQALRQQAEAIPQEQKNRVHFFLVNGLDPLYFGNVNGIAAYYRSLGFYNTTCYQFPMTWKVRRQIETIRRSDPEARIVLMGFSTGANCVRALANNVHKEGIHIDCLVYVGGDTVFNTPSSKPANVGKIVNITGHGIVFLGRDLYFKGDSIDGAVNQRLDARHMSIPTQRETVDLIAQELFTQARQPAGPAPAAITVAPIAPAVIEPASATRPAP